jgi:enoyl-CoA hydratase/carnithine racemase
METNVVLYDRQDTTALITLNRPHRLNAINGALLDGLVGALDSARRDPGAVTVILTGAGRAFCAGEDLKEASNGKSLDDTLRETEMLQEVQRAVMRLGKPLIAAVRGYALGGGCEFAMSCDLRVAAEDAVFGFPETEIGLTVTTAGTKLLTHLVGVGKAKELVFTGDRVGAQEAVRIGLANQAVPVERLMDAALELAGRIGTRSPLALRLSRAALDQGPHSSFEQILALEESHLLTCFASGNYRALVEKKIGKLSKS